MQTDNLVMEILQELRKDHVEVAGSLGELKEGIRNLTAEIKSLRETDQTIHERIDKKDDRIRELEQQVNTDENRITALETTNRNNRIWILVGFTAVIAIATTLAIFF